MSAAVTCMDDSLGARCSNTSAAHSDSIRSRFHICLPSRKTTRTLRLRACNIDAAFAPAAAARHAPCSTQLPLPHCR